MRQARKRVVCISHQEIGLYARRGGNLDRNRNVSLTSSERLLPSTQHMGQFCSLIQPVLIILQQKWYKLLSFREVKEYIKKTCEKSGLIC